MWINSESRKQGDQEDPVNVLFWEQTPMRLELLATQMEGEVQQEISRQSNFCSTMTERNAAIQEDQWDIAVGFLYAECQANRMHTHPQNARRWSPTCAHTAFKTSMKR